jgi:hypothetical protein
MKEMENPPRLFEAEEAPAELRDWLRRAQGDVLSSAEAEQLVQLVESRMMAPPAKVPGFRGVRGSHTVGKFLAGLVVVGFGVGGWYMASRSPSSGPAVIELPGGKPQGSGAPALVPEPTLVAPAPTLDEHASSPVAAKSPHVVHSRSWDRDTVHSTSVATQTPEGATERAHTDEFTLLRSARQAIAAHPDLALALTDEHVHYFPKGMLAQEREAIAVEALVELGRASQAHIRARTFLATHPESPYRHRIQAALLRTSGPKRSP